MLKTKNETKEKEKESSNYPSYLIGVFIRRSVTKGVAGWGF